LFDPDIFADGTFDESTRTLHTGQWGFGGWQYDGIDLSGYKYIVVRLGSANTASVDFRLFDGASYWGSPAIFPFGSRREIVVPLKNTRKNDGNPLNPEHIYIAGFWSNGSNPFVIDTVFLSNSGEYDPPSNYVNESSASDTEVVSTLYFTLSGQRVMDIENQRGVFIVRKKMRDGSLRTRKITIVRSFPYL